MATSQQPEVAVNVGATAAPWPREAGAGNGGLERGVSGDGSESARHAQEEKAARKPLPKPRYGRFIPEGSPPRKAATAAPPGAPSEGNASRQATPPSPRTPPQQDLPPVSSSVPPRHSPPPQHFIPYPGSNRSSDDGGRGRERGSPGATRTGAEEASAPRRNGGVRGGFRAEEVSRPVSRGGGQAASGRDGSERLNGAGGRMRQNLRGLDGKAVDDFREKEREMFFKSKGIEGDVDSFDWDELRRNTYEIQQLQQEAVEHYWRQRAAQSFSQTSYRHPPGR
ncbi:unnamed protein product [Scytosiphon promiscuus]